MRIPTHDQVQHGDHVGHQMEEQEIWEMAAAWIEGDLDTMRRARVLALTEEETEERRTVLRVIFGHAKMNSCNIATSL